MIPDDFDREAICRSISDGVQKAFTEMIFDSAIPTPGRDAILDSIERGVHDAIITIMSATRGHPITRDDIMTMIKEGTAQGTNT